MKLALVLSLLLLGCSTPRATAPDHVENPTAPAPTATSEREPVPHTTAAPAGCTGQATAEMAAELRQHGVDSRRCYEHALLEDGALAGRLVVEAAYGQDGTPLGVKLATDTVGHAAMATCVLGLFDAPLRSPPAGDCVVVRIPLNFKSRPAEAEEGAPPPP